MLSRHKRFSPCLLNFNDPCHCFRTNISASLGVYSEDLNVSKAEKYAAPTENAKEILGSK
jgi:hypothetical protein